MTNNYVRLPVLGLICALAGCGAIRSTTAVADPGATGHPCHTQLVSPRTDNAIFVSTGDPASLFVAGYNVEGEPLAGGLLTLRRTGGDTVVPVAALDSLGTTILRDLEPEHYSITLEYIMHETQTHHLRLTAARTDSVCFVLRSKKLHALELHIGS
jgi:hypothetical protein